MRRQFLLNPDGSAPAGADVPLLEAAGIALVLPAPMPYQPGMVAVEQDAQQDEHGVWRQVWVLELAPEPPDRPETTSDPLASLTSEQKAALLALLQGAPTP